MSSPHPHHWLLVELREPALTTAVTALTHTGGIVAVSVVAAVAVVWLVRMARTAGAVLVAAAVLTGWPVMTLLKQFFDRDRPPQPERLLELQTLSFPSGHAMMSAILATVFAVLAVRSWPAGSRLRLIALTALGSYTVTVGLSRVYLGVHWLTDVVVGWLLGVLWALLWVWLITWAGGAPGVRPWRREPSAEPDLRSAPSASCGAALQEEQRGTQQAHGDSRHADG
ncbi:phosphatase PAP2 family protein [Rhodococcus chondri]|uniref:Phosphatase PAP2 family protein n=1 Tax=Rhodococcus chondri TaxID=3065941 RepID=A0ABU7JV96_9NOCA|nr:phosphatase PAP2 family protein [Rhodococcus sp. CC-R104]MEE2033207.1 phosphatase PAP2 family protein [Rhodococcus sp. CC-R104]